jgi:hypothetical protein
VGKDPLACRTQVMMTGRGSDRGQFRICVRVQGGQPASYQEQSPFGPSSEPSRSPIVAVRTQATTQLQMISSTALVLPPTHKTLSIANGGSCALSQDLSAHLRRACRGYDEYLIPDQWHRPTNQSRGGCHAPVSLNSQWTLILFFIGVFGVEIVAAFVGAWLGPRTLLGLPLQVLVPLVAFALVVAGYTLASRVAAARYRLTLALRPPRPHRGLILLLGPYRPLAPLSQPEVERAPALIRGGVTGQVEAGLEALQLRRSSLWPQLAAIRYHLAGGALRDCWLITTPGGEGEEGRSVRR